MVISKSSAGLLFSYAILSLFHLLVEAQGWETLILITKPLLMLLLAAWFWRQRYPWQASWERWLFLGILFSCGGDSLLMLVSYGPRLADFFLFGLGSFLIAQLSYAYAFTRYPGARNGWVARHYWPALLLFLYLGLFLPVLWPGLGDGLKLPVTVYAIAIATMAASALNLGNVLPQAVFWPLLSGVLLFLLSDSLIAFNKFVAPVPAARFWIMLTYLTAQGLIVWSIGSKTSD
jgi:uncharacterized membrane protein YhhN